MVTPVSLHAVSEGPEEGRRSAVGGEQGGMDVEKTQSGGAAQGVTDQLVEAGNAAHIRPQVVDQIRHATG